MIIISVRGEKMNKKYLLGFFILSVILISSYEAIAQEFRATRICTPGEYTIKEEENAIYACNRDGSNLDFRRDCDYEKGDFIAKYTGTGRYGGYECVKEGVDYSNFFSDYIFVLLIGGVLFLIILIIILLKIREKQQQKKLEEEIDKRVARLSGSSKKKRDELYCPKCKSKIEKNDVFCPKCGKKVK